jgi:3-hydroxymyristoyl/3-hydroxydecanoyl-(acyl carrier protein) dehydratase
MGVPDPVTADGDDKIRLTESTRALMLPADAIWFDGHFPNDPIMPGVAQIQLVLEAVNATLGTVCRIKSLKRIRFRSMIRPGDRFEIETQAAAGHTGTFQFRITLDDNIACTGTIVVEAVNAD